MLSMEKLNKIVKNSDNVFDVCFILSMISGFVLGDYEYRYIVGGLFVPLLILSLIIRWLSVKFYVKELNKNFDKY